MTDITIDRFPDSKTGESYLDEGHSVASWLTTTDHKRIAILYALSITAFFFIGGAAIGLVRLELLEPHGLFLTDEEYNRLFTMHGIIMVWFFLVPSIPTTFGNFLLPMMIGAKDVAFPRLNLMSWYLFVIGATFTIIMIIAGGVDTGWTFYTPLSTLYANGNVIAAAAGVFVTGFSSIATGINFIATTHMLRAPGMTWTRLPLFVWSIYAVSVVMILATPVLAMSLLLVIVERWFGVPIFNPNDGGDPLLFQHLFWFYSHPAVYIMILPAMGVISEIFACFARRKVFGYSAMVYSLMSIAVIGFMVWGHHMFVSGQSPYANLVFSFLSFVVAVPSAIKVFNWVATLYGGQIVFKAPMLYAMGFLGLFTVGGLTGLFLASVPIDIHVTDTYFVVAHFHFIMVGGSVSAFFAA
ncbi:MAG TPA: cbb3-type cytochrome c oxidase subunit I, partial [Pseudolabrys sp.]|nr:cbb3-type cytochrome c oxidase subunit I [Pseudolabrys sp.]